MKPLILDYKVARSNSEYDINYEYDHAQSLSITEHDGMKIALIDSSADTTLHLQTVTKVKEERDDSAISFDLATRTKVSGKKTTIIRIM